ncbi:MAG: hypothetical protein KJI71_01380 [Patescibacteria group bacterium]|nr:hypothetical protein [Patescibacteria group bacterium]
MSTLSQLELLEKVVKHSYMVRDEITEKALLQLPPGREERKKKGKEKRKKERQSGAAGEPIKGWNTKTEEWQKAYNLEHGTQHHITGSKKKKKKEKPVKQLSKRQLAKKEKRKVGKEKLKGRMKQKKERREKERQFQKGKQEKKEREETPTGRKAKFKARKADISTRLRRKGDKTKISEKEKLLFKRGASARHLQDERKKRISAIESMGLSPKDERKQLKQVHKEMDKKGKKVRLSEKEAAKVKEARGRISGARKKRRGREKTEAEGAYQEKVQVRKAKELKLLLKEEKTLRSTRAGLLELNLTVPQELKDKITGIQARINEAGKITKTKKTEEEEAKLEEAKLDIKTKERRVKKKEKAEQIGTKVGEDFQDAMQTELNRLMTKDPERDPKEAAQLAIGVASEATKPKFEKGEEARKKKIIDKFVNAEQNKVNAINNKIENIKRLKLDKVDQDDAIARQNKKKTDLVAYRAEMNRATSLEDIANLSEDFLKTGRTTGTLAEAVAEKPKKDEFSKYAGAEGLRKMKEKRVPDMSEEEKSEILSNPQSADVARDMIRDQLLDNPIWRGRKPAETRFYNDLARRDRDFRATIDRIRDAEMGAALAGLQKSYEINNPDLVAKLMDLQNMVLKTPTPVENRLSELQTIVMKGFN